MNFNYAFMLDKNESDPISVRYLADRQVQLLLPYLAGDTSKRVLEIGPGSGLTMAGLVQAGYTHTEGLEGDETLAKRNQTNGLNVHYVPREEVTPYISGRATQYDLIFCMHVIEHIPVDEQLAFVQAISAALKPGGYFVCETPNAMGLAAQYYRYNDWTHRCLFTVSSLSFLLLNAGLKITYAGGAGDAVPPRGNVVTTFIQRSGAKGLRLISRGIWRFMLFAELGPSGLTIPVQAALRIAGQKPLG